MVGIHIPDGVEQGCEMCFFGCISLLRVIFGKYYSLKFAGKRAFYGNGVGEIRIPDGVKELL